MRTLIMTVATASLLFGGIAIAQTAKDMKSTNDAGMSGDTSGSAKGGNVKPSTAVQKNGRSSTEMNSPAAGSPGVEGPAGSENGPAQTKGAK